MSKHTVPLAIVGAGPNGLAAAWAARRRGIEAVVLDRNPQAGGAWQHMWPAMRCLSPRQFDATPDGHVSRGSHEFASAQEVCEQWQQFARRQHFSLALGTKVHRIAAANEGFVLQLDADVVVATRVIVATGEFDAPTCASLAPDLRQLPHGVVHARDLLPDRLRGLGRVIVVGAGNSAAQVLSAAVHAGARVSLCARTVPGHASAWKSGILSHARFALSGLDLKVWSLSSRCQLRAPLMDPALLQLLGNGVVQRFGAVVEVFEGGVRTAQGERLTADLVVLATGYRRDLDLVSDCDALGPSSFPTHKRGVSVRHPGLGYAGLPCARTLRSGFLRGAKGDAVALVGALLRGVPLFGQD